MLVVIIINNINSTNDNSNDNNNTGSTDVTEWGTVYRICLRIRRGRGIPSNRTDIRRCLSHARGCSEHEVTF